MTKIINHKKQETSLDIPPVDKKILLAEQKTEKKQKLTITAFTIIGFILSVLMGASFFSSLSNALEEKDNTDSQFILGETSSDKETNIQFDPINQIAFISNQNVWVYNLKDSNNIQITNDGGKSYKYTSLAWKNKKELSFSKCNSQNCIIQTYDLFERKTIAAFEIETSNIAAIRWSHQGDKLAYLKQNNNTLELETISNDFTDNLTKMSFNPNKPTDFHDALYIRFSPNDEKIMIVNTFITGNDNSIIVINNSGELISKIDTTQDDMVSFGFFAGNDIIYYKKANNLYTKSLDNKQENKKSDRIVGGYNFEPSPDKSSISYWTYDWHNGTTTIWIYEMGTDTVKRLGDNLTNSSWIDNDTLVSIKNTPCVQCNPNDLETESIVSYDTENKSIVSLIEIDEIKQLSTDNF